MSDTSSQRRRGYKMCLKSCILNICFSSHLFQVNENHIVYTLEQPTNSITWSNCASASNAGILLNNLPILISTYLITNCGCVTLLFRGCCFNIKLFLMIWWGKWYGRPQECIQAFASVQNQIWLLKTSNLYLFFTNISCSQFLQNIESLSGSTSVFVTQISQVTFEILRKKVFFLFRTRNNHMRRPLDRWAWRTSFTKPHVFARVPFLYVEHFLVDWI